MKGKLQIKFLLIKTIFGRILVFDVLYFNMQIANCSFMNTKLTFKYKCNIFSCYFLKMSIKGNICWQNIVFFEKYVTRRKEFYKTKKHFL